MLDFSLHCTLQYKLFYAVGKLGESILLKSVREKKFFSSVVIVLISIFFPSLLVVRLIK